MSSYEVLISKMLTKEVFLINSVREIVLKSLPGTQANFYAKSKGNPIYCIDFSTDLVTETLLEVKEITETEFYNF